jgi:uncharacterized repeat protein (TIGR01451 family)
MKRFFKSKLVLSLAAFLMIAAAVVIPLSGSITHSHAQSSLVTFAKSATPTVAPGGTINYTLTLTNITPTGSGNLHDIHLSDLLPSQTTGSFSAPTFTITPSGSASVDCTSSTTSSIACAVDDFAPGSVVTVSFSVSASNTATGTITNSATATTFSGNINETATANTTIVSTKRGKLFIFIQGIDTSFTQVNIKNGQFPSFQQIEKNGHEEGIYTDLQDHGYSGAHFLEYSYPIDKTGQDQGKTHPYTCADTFTHSINQDVRTLDLQVKNYLNQPNNQNTDIYLIGHSQGGVIAFGYLAYLESQGWPSLPNGGQLKGVVTLDSPIGGVSDDFFHNDKHVTEAYYILHCPNLVPGLSAKNALKLGEILATPNPTPLQLIQLGVLVSKILNGANLSFKSLNNLVDIYNTAPGSNPQGGLANITKIIFPNFSGFKPINQLLAFEAFDSHGIPVLTIGNKLDFTFNPGACGIPLQTNFLTTQVVGDGGDSSGVYGRAIIGGTPKCSFATNIPENHNDVLTTLEVELGILNFLPNGGTPNPLKDASNIL